LNFQKEYTKQVQQVAKELKKENNNKKSWKN